MWSEPLFEKDALGREMAILLMDTQGNFDSETTLTQNATVFAISSLLSSILIFNVMKTIGEDMLQFFQLFASYAIKATGNDIQNTREDFQRLIFLIRDLDFCDYQYGYYDDHSKPQNQYRNLKKDKLDPNPQKQADEVRLTHQHIHQLYPHIGLYALPDPGKDLRRYGRLDNLDPEFRHHLQEFVKLMLTSRYACKRIGGIEVNIKKFQISVFRFGTFMGNLDFRFEKFGIVGRRVFFFCASCFQTLHFPDPISCSKTHFEYKGLLFHFKKHCECN